MPFISYEMTGIGEPEYPELPVGKVIGVELMDRNGNTITIPRDHLLGSEAGSFPGYMVIGVCIMDAPRPSVED